MRNFAWIVHTQATSENFAYEQSVFHLRGGTPFELYQWPYYVSVAHSTLYKDDAAQRPQATLKESQHFVYYTAHLVVLCVQPYRVVYISNALELHDDIYHKIPIVKVQKIEDDYFFPTALLSESADSFVIGGHINDHSSVLIRLRQVQQLLTQVIKLDRESSLTHRGARPGVIQQHVHDVMEAVTLQKFVHTPNTVRNW